MPKAAIIAPGPQTGSELAQRLKNAGWDVAQFEPGKGSISAVVGGAEIVFELGPDRAGYKQKMLQRIQSAAKAGVPIYALSEASVERLRSCATRPLEIHRLIKDTSGWSADAALPPKLRTALRSSRIEPVFRTKSREL
ncbi:MAG: hypothetical protein AAF871_08765 [Pseudomonadota bacterium]